MISGNFLPMVKICKIIQYERREITSNLPRAYNASWSESDRLHRFPGEISSVRRI